MTETCQHVADTTQNVAVWAKKRHADIRHMELSMAPTPSITTTQQIGIGIAHAYSSLLLKAIQNFKISHDMPGFDIFNFLLPRDQIDDILNLEVDIN